MYVKGYCVNFVKESFLSFFCSGKMVYCLYYGVKITKVGIRFSVFPEAPSSKGSAYPLCNYAFETIKAADTATPMDLLFKSTI